MQRQCDSLQALEGSSGSRVVVEYRNSSVQDPCPGECLHEICEIAGAATNLRQVEFHEGVIISQMRVQDNEGFIQDLCVCLPFRKNDDLRVRLIVLGGNASRLFNEILFRRKVPRQNQVREVVQQRLTMRTDLQRKPE